MKGTTNNSIQAFWVSIGSLFSFSFTIVSSMILSRYFLKEDYGTYKQVMYVYHTLLTVFTLGLPKAFSYFLPRVDMHQAKSLIRKITVLFFGLGGVFSLILFVFSSQIAHILKNEDLAAALRVFAPVPFLMLPTMGLDGILATYKKTQFIAIYTVASRVLMLLCVILPVIVLGGGYIYAITGFVGSSFITFLLALYFKYLPLKGCQAEPCPVTYPEIFRFSLPLLYASLWGILINSADQFFISRFFGPSVFADFSNGSMQLPFVGMIIGACSTVLAPVFSKSIHTGANPAVDIFPIWRRVFEKTAKLVYPLIFFFWFYATEIMTLLYGAQYEASGNFFRIKLIVNFFTLIAYGPLILAIGANRFYAHVHLVHAAVLILLESACVFLVPSPYLIVIISVVCRIGTITAILIYLAKHFSIPLHHLIPYDTIAKLGVASAFAIAITNISISPIQASLHSEACLAFVIFSVLYTILSTFFGLQYGEIFRPLLNHRFINIFMTNT